MSGKIEINVPDNFDTSFYKEILDLISEKNEVAKELSKKPLTFTITNGKKEESPIYPFATKGIAKNPLTGPIECEREPYTMIFHDGEPGFDENGKSKRGILPK